MTAPTWWAKLSAMHKVLATALVAAVAVFGAGAGLAKRLELQGSVPARLAAAEDSIEAHTAWISGHELLAVRDRTTLGSSVIEQAQLRAALDSLRSEVRTQTTLSGQILCLLEGLSQPQCLQRLARLNGGVEHE